MKVRVSFTVDVDPSAWRREFYGDDAPVRGDVAQYCESAIMAQLESIGVLRDDAT